MTNKETGRRCLRGIAIGLASVIVLAAAGFGGWLGWNHTALARSMDGVRRAGYVEKDATVDGVRIHYAEGPANGKPTLLLIHGQSVDWRSYADVLPELSRDFHVYAVDCFGHGSSEHDPRLYAVVPNGRALVAFMDQVMGEPAYVSGHSSGGVLAAWIAGNAPDRVRGTLLEDPPLYTTTLPRATTTWNYVDLASACHGYLTSGSSDWTAYAWEHQRLWRFFGDKAQSSIDDGLGYHAKHPDRPISVWWAPQFDRYNELMTGYDPRFGEAFYTGSWNDGFNEDATLGAIRRPVTLVHTKVAYDDQGILMAAMDADAADRARRTIPGVEFVKVETGHEFHAEDASHFASLMRDVARV